MKETDGKTDIRHYIIYLIFFISSWDFIVEDILMKEKYIPTQGSLPVLSLYPMQLIIENP